MSPAKKKKSPKQQKATDRTRGIEGPEAPETRPQTRRALWVVVGIAAFAAAMFWFRGAGAPSRAEPFNVILISVDTLRADHLSAYGKHLVATPHIDRLASEGVLFEQATSVAPTTLPAHASLLTGLTPLRHGVHDNVGFYLTEEHRTLAHHLREHGYLTAGFVGSFVLDARFGLARGFDDYDDALGSAADVLEAGWVAQRPGSEVLASFVDWLGSTEREDSPFFAFVHFYDPHTPYTPPDEFLPQTAVARDTAAAYRGEVAFVDSLVGGLLDELERRGLHEETLVVLTSDHGESLGEHRELTHGFFLYESTLRIPMILRYPRAPEGTRVTTLARIEDLAPTIVDLLNLPPMEDIDGESLVPAIDNRDEGNARIAYAQTFVPRLEYGFSELRSLRRAEHKLVLAPRLELYDLIADPSEETNLAEAQPGLARQMRKMLEELVEAEVVATTPAPLDADARARLESLGYLGGGATLEGIEGLYDPKDYIDVNLLVNDPDIPSLAPSDGAKYEETIAALREVISRFPAMPRAHILLGDLLFRGNRPAEAAIAFERLVELNEARFEGHYGLGVALAGAGQWTRAVEALEKARAIEPGNTKSYFHLAEVAANTGEWDAAETWLRKAIEVREDPVLVGRLAEVLAEQGRLDEARAILREQQSKRPEDSAVAIQMADLLSRGPEPMAAVEELRRAISSAPENLDLYQALADTLAQSGRLEEAVPEYRRAIALSDCLAPAHMNLGTTLAQLGLVKEASQALETAVRCEPNYSLAYKNLAALQMELGNVDQAIQAMAHAVRTSPGDLELEKSLEELRAYASSRGR